MADVQRWIDKVEAVFDSQSGLVSLSGGETKIILTRIQKLVKAKAATAEALELGGRATLLLCRIPHILDADSLSLLVGVVDSLIFGLISKVTAGKDNYRQELREVGKLVALILEECSKENRRSVLEGCLDTLGGAIINTNLPVWLRTMCIKGFNALLEESRTEERSLVWEKLNMKMEVLFSFILACGVYDTQAAVVELIFRISSKVDRQKTAEALIADDKALQLFLKIGSNFEATCRKFLNQLNLSLGNKCKVFPFPIVSCTVDGRSVFKPDAEDFWVDFNMGKEDRGLAFYGIDEEGSEDQWQLEVILQEEVLEVNISFPTPKCMLVSISRSDPGVIELAFECSYFNQILQILRQLFGGRLKETNMSKPEPASSTPKKALLLPKGINQNCEVVESPENTSIPPSEEEEVDHESLPCAQASQEQVEKEEMPNKQIRTYSRQAREEKVFRGKTKASMGMSTPKSKVIRGAKSYSPVVMIGEARVGTKAKKGENDEGEMDVGRKKEESLKKVEKVKSKMPEHITAGTLAYKDQDQIDATPEMVGGPGVREDVPMTRSGGRKRAMRKVPESSRQKMQDRAKPTQLDFQDDSPLTKDEAKLGDSSGLVGNNKSDTCDQASTSRGRKTFLGLKKMLGKVPEALGFSKNTSRRVSVSPTLGDISEVSARGFQKRRAPSACREKRRKLVHKSEKAANERDAREDQGEKSNASGGVEVRPIVCEADAQSKEMGEKTIGSPKKLKGSHQEKRRVNNHDEEEEMVEVDPQEGIGPDFQAMSKNQLPATSTSCRPLDGEEENGGHLDTDEEQEGAERRSDQGEKGSARRSGGGDSLPNASSRLQQSMLEQEAAGLAFLRLANPVMDVLVRASTSLKLEQQEELQAGWMAIKKALAEQDDD